MIRTSRIRNVDTDQGTMFVVDLFLGGLLMETRDLPGKNKHYANDVAENWENGIIKLTTDK